MLDRIAVSDATATDTAPDPYAWRDNGERWVKEPRRLAPALDSFMSHVHRLGAEQIMFSTWKRASFRLWGDNHWVDRPPLDEAETGLIVNHLYGADGMARIQGGKDLNVMYVIGVSRTETLRYRVNVSGIATSKGDGANVTIRPVKELPPLLEKQNVEPEILASYRVKKGLVVVSGATGSGKSTLIGGMTLAKLLDPNAHLNILECAEPIEFLFDRVKSPSSTINQSEIPRHIESFEAFMEGAMRRQPDEIIVGECRKPEHMEATVKAALSGHAACTTIHAETVALTMQRVAGLFRTERLDDMMVSTSQVLRLVINQRLVKDRSGKFTPLREFLVFDSKLREKLGRSQREQWPDITAEAVEKQGQSYRKAIQIALQEGRITEEIAAAERDSLA